jgi:hypothetical protein
VALEGVAEIPDRFNLQCRSMNTRASCERRSGAGPRLQPDAGVCYCPARFPKRAGPDLEAFMSRMTAGRLWGLDMGD